MAQALLHQRRGTRPHRHDQDHHDAPYPGSQSPRSRSHPRRTKDSSSYATDESRVSHPHGGAGERSHGSGEIFEPLEQDVRAACQEGGQRRKGTIDTEGGQETRDGRSDQGGGQQGRDDAHDGHPPEVPGDEGQREERRRHPGRHAIPERPRRPAKPPHPQSPPQWRRGRHEPERAGERKLEARPAKGEGILKYEDQESAGDRPEGTGGPGPQPGHRDEREDQGGPRGRVGKSDEGHVQPCHQRRHGRRWSRRDAHAPNQQAHHHCHHTHMESGDRQQVRNPGHSERLPDLGVQSLLSGEDEGRSHRPCVGKELSDPGLDPAAEAGTGTSCPKAEGLHTGPHVIENEHSGELRPVGLPPRRALPAGRGRDGLPRP